MKILQVIPYLYPALSFGGPAKVVYELSEELAKKHNVTIYTTDAWDENRRIKEDEKIQSKQNLKIKYFKNLVNNIAYKNRFFFTPIGMVRAYFKEKDKYDIVHINDVFILPNILIAFIAIIYKKPYIYSPHGVLDPVRLKQKSVKKAFIYKFFAERLLLGSEKIVATSEKENEILSTKGFKNVKTIYNGISTKTVKPSRRFQNYVDNKRLTLLYIGKIHRLKGLGKFVKALKYVNIPYQLLIAGPDDGYLEELKTIIANINMKQIHFLGYVNESEKAELFSIADVFIHPSLSEGFSISILESLKYSVPVLVTESCNFPNISKYNAGVVLDNNYDPKEVKEILYRLAEKPSRLQRMGKNACKLLMEKYSIQVMSRTVEETYKNIFKNS